MRIPLSVVTIAHNEEKNIESCLKSTQAWADEHIIVDDFSSDRTVEIARRYTDKIFQRKMDIEGRHRNWAYQKAKNEWVLSLDADEIVTEELKKEISEAIKNQERSEEVSHKILQPFGLQDDPSGKNRKRNSPRGQFDAYSIPLRTYIGDYWVRYGGWYPAGKLRLFKKSKFRYEEVGVHPRIILDGSCGHLTKDIIHKGYSDFSDLFHGLNIQTTLEAEKWFNEKRRIGVAKMLWKAGDRFFRSFVRKKGYKDGIVGFVIAVHSALYQIFSYVKYWELKHEPK